MSVVDLDQARLRLRSRGVSMLDPRGLAVLDLGSTRVWVTPAPGGGVIVHVDTAIEGVEIAVSAEQLAAALRGAP